MNEPTPRLTSRKALQLWGLLLTPVALIFAFAIFRVGQRNRATMEQRQNRVLAQDALRASQAVADLYIRAAEAARALSVLPAGSPASLQVLAALSADNGQAGNVSAEYKRLLFSSARGKVLHFERDRQSHFRPSPCTPGLCDTEIAGAAHEIPVGKAILGRPLRWYRPESEPEGPDSGTVSVAFRGENGVVVVGVDYRSLLQFLKLPVFPYNPRGDLLEDYEKGNYIYLLDRETNVIAHPKHWHSAGLDRMTFAPVTPATNDDETGSHPLNFRAYREGKLRGYFDRFLSFSLLPGEVAVFRASNLSGMDRVISIAPVSLPTSLFVHASMAGFVGVGCAVEYFKEPEEKMLPYY